MKRRFVRAVFASIAAACVLGSGGRAHAQEIQLTGPLKGAPAARHMREYREGRFEISPAVTFSLLDEYRHTILVGGRLTYNIKDWIGLGIWGGAGAISTTTDLTDKINQVAPRNALTVTNVTPGNFANQVSKIDYIAAPQLTFTPFRGKLAIFNKIFVDTDLYAAAGVAIVGIEERGNCAQGTTAGGCSTRESFALKSSTKVTGTFGVGLTFYPGNFWSLGVEYRAVPFAWNRAGFDSRGSGPSGNFPDGQVNGNDETFQFNQFVTVSLGFYLPTTPKLSE